MSPLGLGGAFILPSPPSGTDDCTQLYRAGSGFKLHIESLSEMTLNLGPHTTSPLASIGVSVNYGEFTTVNVSEGSNIIPLDENSQGQRHSYQR